jgi:hypothetical protein
LVALILLAPLALVASLLEAWLRTGATVHLVARRPRPEDDARI